MNHSYRKFVFPAVLATVLLTTAASAQNANSPTPANPAAPATNAATPEFHRVGPMRRLGFRRAVAEKLGLTTDQRSQICAARQSARQQLQAIRADTTLTPEEKKARIRSVVDSTRQQMRQVLTPDQQQKLDQMRAEHAAPVQPQPAPNQ